MRTRHGDGTANVIAAGLPPSDICRLSVCRPPPHLPAVLCACVNAGESGGECAWGCALQQRLKAGRVIRERGKWERGKCRTRRRVSPPLPRPFLCR